MANNKTTQSDQAATEFSETTPDQLSDFRGADHFGFQNIAFDADTLPDDPPAHVENRMEFALDCLNHVRKYPHVVFWIRTVSADLLLAHHPEEGDERPDCLRVLRSSRTDPRETGIGSDNKCESGLLTMVDAVNAVFDRVAETSDNNAISTVIADIKLVKMYTGSEHPVLDIPESYTNWGRYNSPSFASSSPTDNDIVALESLGEADVSGAAALEKHLLW